MAIRKRVGSLAIAVVPWAKGSAWGLVAAFLLAGVTGCTGMVDNREPGEQPGANEDPTMGEPGLPSPEDIPAGSPGPTALRKLTNDEYRSTVQDLLGLSDPPADALSPETSTLGYDNFASAGTVSATLGSQYSEMAARLAAEAKVDTLAPCASAAKESECADTFITSFGKRVHRRPLSTAEAQSYRGIYDLVRTTGTFADGIKLVVETMLQSPYLLYRSEYGTSGAQRKLTPYEVASELSYTFLGSMPDAELMAAADENALETSDQLEAQARRLLKLPRAKATMRRFVNQWLTINSIASVQKNTTEFPMFDDKLRNDMLAESTRLVDSVLWEQDGMVKSLLTAPFTFINSALAGIYGLPDPGEGDTFVKTTLNPKERAGILTHPAVLSVHSKQNDSFPIARGEFIRVRILCQALPPPPKDANLSPPPPDSNLTTRERFARHSAEPACAGCHALIDPVGFGLEAYDAIGRYRTMENGRPIDASGMLTDTDVDGPYTGGVELAGKLASSALVRQCAAVQAARWVYGRAEIETDKQVATAMESQLGGDGMDIREMLISIVKSESFLARTFVQ